MYQDKILICRDCGAEFVWSAGEQEFFAQKGFDKPPTRCPECRKKRRTERDGKPAASAAVNNGPKQLYPIVCANCGKTGEVPFKPESANILCADCFRKQHTVVEGANGPEVKEVAEAPAAESVEPVTSEVPEQPASPPAE